MERSERFQHLHRRLKNGQQVSSGELMEELEVSRATLMRDIEYLRDRYQAPIVYDRGNHCYGYAQTADASTPFELPGLWFSADELHALLTMHTLLEQMGSGLLSESIHALKGKLEQMLGDSNETFRELRRRVRILSSGQRLSAGESFAAVARAVVERRQLQIDYRARTTNETIQRVISPQRLVHYRGNWYVDSWCHLRNGIRNFAVDGIRELVWLETPCKELTDAELDKSLGADYGVFTTGKRKWATLRFSLERSRWIRDEVWHPDQTMRIAKDGQVTLRVPYSQPLEIAMDTLRHAGHVEVIEPAELREMIVTLAKKLVTQQKPHRGS